MTIKQDYKEPVMYTGLIYKKISDALRDIESIEKNQKNQSQGYKTRGIDDVYNAVHDIFAKHNIFSVTNVISESYEERTSKSGTAMNRVILKIEFTVYAEDGSKISGVTIGEAMDSSDKATNKAMSIAHKYFLIQLFAIPTKETDDPDKYSPEIISKEAELKNKYLSEISKANSIDELKVIYNNAKANIKTTSILTEVTDVLSIRKVELKEKNNVQPL